MVKTHLLVALLICAPSSAFAQDFDNSEVATQSQDLEHLIELFTVGGRPRNLDEQNKVKILVNHGYAVGYSESRRCPLWAVYTASKLADGEISRYERSQFFPADTRTTPAVDGRTFGGGFDRGHMVPNAAIGNQYGSLAQFETFFMTNMCPQKAELNQGAWQRLEKWIIDAGQTKQHIHVICGPIFGDENPAIVSIGPERGIQIPSAFYMILVDTEREFQERPAVRLLAYEFSQTTPRNADFTDREEFGTSVDMIELATKLDFFPTLERLFANWDEREAEFELEHWTIE